MVNGWQVRSNADDGWDPAVESDLAMDDERISPHQTSHLAQGGILSAIDNLQALMLLTVEHRSLHAFAPATLARAAMECASMAIWVLKPEDRGERILRTLKSSTETSSTPTGPIRQRESSETPAISNGSPEWHPSHARAPSTSVQPSRRSSQYRSGDGCRHVPSKRRRNRRAADVATDIGICPRTAMGFNGIQ